LLISIVKIEKKSDKVALMQIKCKYGSETHQRVTHKDCPENPKNKQGKGDYMENITKDTCCNGNLEVSDQKKALLTGAVPDTLVTSSDREGN